MISVGIDVSKGHSTVCIIKPGGEVLKQPFEISHTLEEVLSLVNIIKNYDEEVRVVLETTGHYHWPVVTVLVENDIFVCQVNSLRMKRYCSQSIRRAKTDKIDSVKIASYGISYWHELERIMPSNETYAELRMLSRQYYHTVSLMIKAKVHLTTLLDRVMPGIKDIMDDSKGHHRLTDFVKRYYHFEHIKEMGKRFKTDFCKWAKKQGYRQHERLLERILGLVQNGIPVLPNTLSTKITVQEAVRVLQEIEASRDIILSQMQALAKTLPEYSVVREMNGIADVLAPRLIAEIGDIRRFKNKHSLIAYAGIDAPPFQSGQFCGTERHISKRGNKYLRKTGYELMQSLVMHKPEGDPVFEFIQKKRSEGKCGKEAMVAGLNKFLRVYYGKVSELYSSINEELSF
ncbi:MAG: IS110 family transposase [Ruminococcus sp.]